MASRASGSPSRSSGSCTTFARSRASRTASTGSGRASSYRSLSSPRSWPRSARRSRRVRRRTKHALSHWPAGCCVGGGVASSWTTSGGKLKFRSSFARAARTRPCCYRRGCLASPERLARAARYASGRWRRRCVRTPSARHLRVIAMASSDLHACGFTHVGPYRPTHSDTLQQICRAQMRPRPHAHI